MTSKSPYTNISKNRGLHLPTPISAAIVLLPPTFSFILLYLLRLPFPYQDDFLALLGFAVQYDHAPGVAAKALDIAVMRHNEYRLIFQHLLVAAEVELTHHVSFVFLTALGDLFLVGIAVLLWCSFDRDLLNRKLLHFLPVSLLFFGLAYWEALNWATASLMSLPVIFFALMALYFLVPQDGQVVANDRFLISCIAACLACCCSANGFLLAPVGVMMIASRRCYKFSIPWLVSFVLPFCAYIYHGTETPVHYSFHLKQIPYFIAFFGGFFPVRLVAFLVGAITLSIFAWAAHARLTRHNPVMFFLAVWIVLTGAVVEALRTSLASRYSIYSVLLLICCYSFLLHAFGESSSVSTKLANMKITREHFLRFSIALSLLFYVQADISAYLHLQARREMVIKGLKYYRLNPELNSPQANPEVDRVFPGETPYELYMLKLVAREHLYIVPSEQELEQY